MRGGLFISFEGPEGAGKSTQIRRLAERLRASGVTVLETREPGGTPLGERIRALLLDPGGVAICAKAEALLHNAARAQHVEAVIEPALARGEVVVCDRFADSTLAYQGGGRGLDQVGLRQLQSFTVGPTQPDLRILVDVPIQIGLDRRMRAADTVNRLDAESLAFHERVRAAFLELVRAAPDRWVVVDGSKEPDDVEQSIWRAVSPRMLSAEAVRR